MLYEFTITLLPHLYSKTAKEQKSLILGPLTEILAIYRVSAIFELTSTNNVHVHMMIDFKDHLHRNKFIDSLRPLKKGKIGRCSCSQLINQGKWENYMRKDLESTRLIIGDPIIKDSFNILCDPQYRFVFIDLLPIT